MKPSFSEKIKNEKLALIVLIIALIIFVGMFVHLHPKTDDSITADDYVEYEKGTVTAVLSDNLVQDPASDNGWRGEQMLTVKVTSGQYKGEEMLVYNYVGPLYGVPVYEGDGVTLSISTRPGGNHEATVFEYNRIPFLAIIVLVFFAVIIIIGRKTGFYSLLGLVFTILCLFAILIPLLLRGAPTIPATFLMSAYIALVSFTLLGGIHRKTISAFLGTTAGTALAMIFGLASQALTRVSGLRMSNVEPLLQLRQTTEAPIGLQGLLVAGIIISALGAVMDVAMSISSSLEEVHSANPELTARRLFRSGMNIGRDMVGTMTNTLILAFLGSGFTLIIYLHSLGLSFYQLFSSAYASIEVISGVSSSIGMILAIPLTALISSALLAGDKGNK